MISNNLPRLSLWIGFMWQQQQGAALCKKQVPQGTWIIAQPLLVTTAVQQAMSSVCARSLQAGIQNENVEAKHTWEFALHGENIPAQGGAEGKGAAKSSRGTAEAPGLTPGLCFHITSPTSPVTQNIHPSASPVLWLIHSHTEPLKDAANSHQQLQNISHSEKKSGFPNQDL